MRNRQKQSRQWSHDYNTECWRSKPSTSLKDAKTMHRGCKCVCIDIWIKIVLTACNLIFDIMVLKTCLCILMPGCSIQRCNSTKIFTFWCQCYSLAGPLLGVRQSKPRFEEVKCRCLKHITLFKPHFGWLENRSLPLQMNLCCNTWIDVVQLSAKCLFI